MTNYPPADGSRWYATRYPGAKIDPNVGVLHTTETTGLPDYQGGATAPHYTAVPDFARKRLRWFAHFPDEQSSRALRNEAGGVETNTLNALQVELVGTCAPGVRDQWRREGRGRFIFWANPPWWAIRDLAKFVAWANKTHGIKVQAPAFQPYPASYGPRGRTNTVRFTFAQWRNFYGWCGHQHVPENSHGDPGALPWGKVQAKAEKFLNPAKVSPRWDSIYETAQAIQGDLPAKAKVRHKTTQAIMDLASRFSVTYHEEK